MVVQSEKLSICMFECSKPSSTLTQAQPKNLSNKLNSSLPPLHIPTTLKPPLSLPLSHSLLHLPLKMAEEETTPDPQTPLSPTPSTTPPPTLSKNAQKKLLKQQKYEQKKAQKKAAIKEQKQREAERKRREWAEKLSGVSEEEKLKLLESRKELRKERMDKRTEEREQKAQRLTRAKESGQKIVVDLEFAHLMTGTEIHSLVQQIMYCYAVNGRCTSPAHLWLTGCQGEIGAQLEKLPGFDKWVIEKENRSYIEALEDGKGNLVYLTADSENVLEELDLKSIYIIGGLVDRNRWKGVTMKKATEQGIQTAKLPIDNFLKMSSSQVLTVNQVVEILLKFLETRDWKTSFFQVIPQRKRGEIEAEDNQEVEDKEDEGERKKKCIEQPNNGEANSSNRVFSEQLLI